MSTSRSKYLHREAKLLEQDLWSLLWHDTNRAKCLAQDHRENRDLEFQIVVPLRAEREARTTFQFYLDLHFQLIYDRLLIPAWKKTSANTKK